MEQMSGRPTGCQSTRHITNSSHGQVVTLYKSTRQTVNSAYSQLVADIVTKHCIFIITLTSTLQAEH